MTVHAQSVIPTWWSLIDYAFYDHFTSMENWTYLNPAPGTIATWQAQFSSFNTYFTAWKASAWDTPFYEALSAFYGYYVYHIMYGTDFTQGPSFVVGSSILTMGGFTTYIKGLPINWFDDYDLGTGSSAKITAALAYVNGTPTPYQLDVTGLTSLHGQMVSVISAQNAVLVATHVTPLILTAPTRAEMDAIVLTGPYGWSGAVSQMTSPSFLLPPGY